MTRHALVFAAVLLLAACSTPVKTGTDAQLRDIDGFVTKTLRTLPEVPSIGLAIALPDGRSYTRGYGYADRERGIASDADTGYYNGSNTKAYTSLLCAMLAQEGVLDLDVPVSKYLPELQFPAPIEPSQTTLRRFLSHTSGIANDAIVLRTAFTGEHTPAELIRILGLSKPGKEGFRYDNLGYVVASLVLERITGKKWQDVLDERLFDPLGMSRTTAYMSEARRQRMALPYDMTSTGAMAPTEYGWKDDSMMHAAGGIVTTPNDLVKFLRKQLAHDPAVRVTQKQEIATTRDSFLFDGTGYGFGWYQADLHGEELLCHGGGYEGWRSVYSLLPRRQIAVGALTNAGLSHSPLELVSAYAYDRLLDVPDVDKTYEEKLAQLRARFDKVKQAQIDEAQKRAARPWSLQHPLSAYAGQYDHPAVGTMTVEQRGNTLVASVGRLNGTLEAYIEPESARVVFAGNGEVLQFVFTRGDTPDALKWGEEVMTRRAR
ncbi:MAG TPA: serine hydrolase [Thermoanaerobaculia bacterium]|nr:serine hydrolase [Thermoanaerobaculia bacterium]